MSLFVSEVIEKPAASGQPSRISGLMLHRSNAKKQLSDNSDKALFPLKQTIQFQKSFIVV
jgi:hypothetical protein